MFFYKKKNKTKTKYSCLGYEKNKTKRKENLFDNTLPCKQPVVNLQRIRELFTTNNCYC